MSEMTACCGIVCSQCNAFLATAADDDSKRTEVAKTWSAQYDHEFKPQDINCDGCTSGSERLFSHCSVCEIRTCATEKALPNCAHCDDYACEKLDGFFKMIPDAKTNLDTIKAGL